MPEMQASMVVWVCALPQYFFFYLENEKCCLTSEFSQDISSKINLMTGILQPYNSISEFFTHLCLKDGAYFFMLWNGGGKRIQ